MTAKQIEYRLQCIIFDMQAADAKLISRVEFDTITPGEVRSLAATLITGDTQYVRTPDESDRQAALAPDWGSWIEGQPLMTAVLSNRAVLIDLHPLDPVEFAHKYRCTVGQFIATVKWFVRHRKRIHINLISLDPSEPASIGRYAAQVESIGLILQELEDNSLFYCLPVRRIEMFSLSAGGRPADLSRLGRAKIAAQGFVDEHYPRFIDALEKCGDPERLARLTGAASVRGNTLIAAGQLAWRLAYYRAYRSIFETPDETELDALLRLGNPEPEEFAELARLATLYHHRYTAPITGAFGGVYNMRMLEYGPMLTQVALEGEDAVQGSEVFRATSDAEARIWSMIATERVGFADGEFRNLENNPGSMMRRENVVDDETVNYVLNQAKPVTDDILSYREELLRQMRSSVAGSKTLRKRYGIADGEGWEVVDSIDEAAMISEMEFSVRQARNIFGALKNRVAFTLGTNVAISAAKQSIDATIGIAAIGIPEAIEAAGQAAGQFIGEEAKLALRRGVGRTYPRTQILDVLTNISKLQQAARRPERRA